jgi:Isochorismatase family
MSRIPRLTIADSAVIVIDIQDKLLAAIPNREELVRNCCFLLDVATLLGVEALATEQYPKGLGPTTGAIAKRFPQNIPAKTSFSCCGSSGFSNEWKTNGKQQAILVGMETHVCVAQTALDLRLLGVDVFLAVDAIGSRHEIDETTAIRRLERAGCVPTTVESIAFEWLADSTHPHFKTISKMIVERTNSPRW